MLKYISGAALAAAVMVSSSAEAHFQLVYTPKVNLEKPGTIPFKLIFWHPFDNGHVMDMEKPTAFYSLFKGKKTDLLDTLRPTTFKGAENEGVSFDGSLKVKRNGDYTVVVEPVPYFEPSEELYIQEITKVYVNKGGIPTDWNEPAGLITEILPLNKPTNIVTGSTFTGQVLSEGKPVAGAEIEVEYIAAEPNMETGAAGKSTAHPTSGGSLVAVSDANGYFTFGIPKAGFWGFSALGSGPQKEYEGKELEQDAVIWIRAYDLD